MLVQVTALMLSIISLLTMWHLYTLANGLSTPLDNSLSPAFVVSPQDAAYRANHLRQACRWSELCGNMQWRQRMHGATNTKLVFSLVDAHWQASMQPLTKQRDPMERWFDLQQQHKTHKWKRQVTGTTTGKGSVVVAVDHRKSIAVQRYLRLCQNAMWMHKCGNKRCKRTVVTIEAYEPSTSGEQAATTRAFQWWASYDRCYSG